MVELSAEARRHVRRLREFYDEKDRPAAALNLERALSGAIQRIACTPEAGIPAPRPYPGLAAEGRLWIKEGRYWFRYRPSPPPPVIVAVFFETADIPSRAQSTDIIEWRE